MARVLSLPSHLASPPVFHLKIPRFIRILAGSVLGLVLLTLAGLGVLQTDAVSTGVVRSLAARFAPETMSIRLTGAPRFGLGGVTVVGVVVDDPALGFRVRLDTLRVDYRLTQSRWKRIAVDRVEVVGLSLEVEAGGETPPSPAPTTSEEPGGEPWSVVIQSVALRSASPLPAGAPAASSPLADASSEGGAARSFRVGRVSGSLEGLRLTPELGAAAWTLDAEFAPSGHPDGWGSLAARGDWVGPRLRLDTLDLRSPRSRVSGRLSLPLDSTLSRPGGVDWRLEARPLALADLDGLVPVPGVLEGDSLILTSWSETVGDSAAVQLEAETSTGATATAELRWGRDGSRFGYRGELQIGELDLRRYLGDGTPLGSTSGNVSIDGSLAWEAGAIRTLESSLQAALNAPEAEADFDARVVRAPGAEGEPQDSLELRFRRLRWGQDIEGNGRVAVVRNGDAARWDADLRPRTGGRIAGAGTLGELGAEAGVQWAADLRLDSVIEPRSASSLTGRVRGQGVGAALPTTLSASLSPSQVAGWPMDTATVAWAAGDGDGRVQGWVDGPLGQLRVDADVGIQEDGGRLQIRSLELDSIGPPPAPAGEGDAPWRAIRLTGRLDGALGWTGPVSSAGDPSRWSGEVDAVLLQVTGADGVPPLDSLNSTIRLQAGTLDGRLQAALPGGGEVSLRAVGTMADPLDIRVSEGLLREVDLSTLLASAPPTRLNGTVSGRVQGTPGGAGTSVRGRIDLGPSMVRDGQLGSLGADIVLTPDSLQGDIVAELAGGTVSARLEGPAARDGTRWRVEADAVLPRLGAFFGLPDTAVSLTGRVAARSDPASGTEVDLGLSDFQGWGARVDTAALRGRLYGPVLTVDTLLVRSTLLAGDGGGTLPRAVLGLPGDSPSLEGAGERPFSAAPGTSSMALTLSVPDSAAALRLGDTQVEVGAGRADFRADCLEDDCDLSGELDFAALLLDRWAVSSLQAGVNGSVGSGRRFGPTRTTALVEGIRTPRLDARNASVQTHWNGTDLEVVASAVVDDRREAAAELRVDPEARSLAFHQLDVRLDEDRWSLERPVTFQSDSSGMSLDSLVLTSAPQRILARFGEEDGARLISVEVQSLRLGAFSDLLGRPGLGGSTSGQLRVRGEEERLVLVGDLTADLTLGGRPSHRIEAQAEARDGTFSGELAVRDSLGGARITGRAQGAVPGVGDPGWTATLELDDLPLGWAGLYAPPEVIREASGSLNGNVALEGGPQGISAQGPLGLSNGRLEIPLAGIVVQDVRVAARLADRTLRVDSASATSRGHLALEGSLTLPADGTPPEIAVRVTADDFLASNTRMLEAAFGGDIQVDGSLDVPRVTGQLQVLQASYRIPANVGARRVREVTLTDEDWAVLQSRFGITRPEQDGGSTWVPRSAVLDVSVALGRDIWLRRDANPELALQFTGDVRVTKASQEDELQLQGRIETISGRSYVEEFGRRFSIEEGTLALRGPLDDTRLDVTGEYRVPTSPDEDPVTIRLNVTGWVDRLELALSSEPSLSNGDIVSYLATGRPASSAFSGDGTGSGLGADILASQLTGSLEQFAQEEAGLDVLRIQQEGLHGTSLTAGKYVNPRLFLGFRQGVTYQADDGQSFSDGLTSQAEVEYAALDWLMLDIQGGTSAIRFFLEATYGW